MLGNLIYPRMVSCLMPTFGRPPDYLHLLEEAVESFRRQDYEGQCELIILNDCPGQQLSCDLPGVRVVNVVERLPSLGDKYNLMIRLTTDEVCGLLLPWEDDDISLPGRISQAVEQLATSYYWNPQRTFYLAGDTLHTDHHHGVCHNASIFSLGAWTAVNGYESISGPQDAVMDARLRAIGPMNPPLPDDPETWQYIYCWGRSDIHLSAHRDTRLAYIENGRKPVQSGRFSIVPRWHRDYLAITEAACRRK